MLPRQVLTSNAMPAPQLPIGHVRLQFGGSVDEPGHPVHDLSAAAFVGTTLFVAGDEGARIERLLPTGDGVWGDHAAFDLAALLGLDSEAEIDVEGMAYAEDDWLWVTGSHARTRPKPRRSGGDGEPTIDIDRLANLKDTRARCLLARLPLALDEAGHVAPVARDGARRAGHVRLTKKHGSKLARMFAEHPLIGPFTRIAAKEGGLDIEGIAVAGAHVALGLRGPVIAGHAMLAEPIVLPKKRGRLHLAPRLAVRLLDLGGFGIRDLRAAGDDLLILAGPTQDIDGRCAVYRWAGWRTDLPADTDRTGVHRPERLFDLPVRLDCDHAEAIDWLPGGVGSQLMVLHDSPAPDRIDRDACALLGDVLSIGGTRRRRAAD
jgi:hypothetical protein